GPRRRRRPDSVQGKVPGLVRLRGSRDVQVLKGHGREEKRCPLWGRGIRKDPWRDIQRPRGGGRGPGGGTPHPRAVPKDDSLRAALSSPSGSARCWPPSPSSLGEGRAD